MSHFALGYPITLQIVFSEIMHWLNFQFKLIPRWLDVLENESREKLNQRLKGFMVVGRCLLKSTIAAHKLLMAFLKTGKKISYSN